MRKRGDYLLYDLYTKQEIHIPFRSVKTISLQLGIDYTALSKLGSGGNKSIRDRYILPSDKSRIFTIVDIDSGREYDCINNRSLFNQLGVTYTENEGKYVYELKVGRQRLASIAGRVFELKGGKKCRTFSNMKAKSVAVQKMLDRAKEHLKIKNHLYTRMYQALRRYGTKKAASYCDLSGCTNEQFYKYIEGKFTKGMTWENRNLWHLDHIKPCSSFDLTNPKDQLRCFHYTNIQPIWKSNDTAKDFGEGDLYVGNQNKSDSGDSYDYWLVDLIENEAKGTEHEMERDKLIELAKHLFNGGIRKVVPEHEDGTLKLTDSGVKLMPL